MAEINNAPPVSGFTRFMMKSPKCTACPAHAHQWCQQNDIISHAQFGTGWKNSGEEGCGFLACNAKCIKDYADSQKHSCCLGLNPNETQNCHPDWKDGNSESCRQFQIDTVAGMLETSGTVDTLPPKTKLWLNNPANSAKYEELKKGTCPRMGGNAPQNSVCDIWCNSHPNECHQGRMSHCTQGNNIVEPKCQNWKDVGQNAQRDITTFLNAEEKWCASSEENMRSDKCTRWATDPKILTLSRSTKVKYDDWWHGFCDKVHNYNDKKPTTWAPKNAEDLDLATKQCSCTLKPGIDPNDKTTLFSNPYCFNPICMSRPEAYRTLQGMDDKRQCPNVCSNIIQNTAGTTGIIRNINIVQNCFNAKEQTGVENTIRTAIEKELKVNIESMLKTYVVTGTEYSRIFADFIEKNKPNLEAWHKAAIEIKSIDTHKYQDMSKYDTYLNIEDLVSELKIDLPKLVGAYEKITTMKWPSTTPAEVLGQEYSKYVDAFATLLQGRRLAMDEYAKDVERCIKHYQELISERKFLIESARQVHAKLADIVKIPLDYYVKHPLVVDAKDANMKAKIYNLENRRTNFSIIFLDNVLSNAVLRGQVKTLEDYCAVIAKDSHQYVSEMENFVGGNIEERAHAMKLDIDKKMGVFNTEDMRVLNLRATNKLSESDKEHLVELEKHFTTIKQGNLDFTLDYGKMPKDLIALAKSRDMILGAIDHVLPKLIAIKEFIPERIVDIPPPGSKEIKEPGSDREVRIPPKEPKEPKEPSGSDDTWMYIAAAVVLFAVVGGGVYMYNKKKRED